MIRGGCTRSPWSRPRAALPRRHTTSCHSTGREPLNEGPGTANGLSSFGQVGQKDCSPLRQILWSCRHRRCPTAKCSSEPTTTACMPAGRESRYSHGHVSFNDLTNAISAFTSLSVSFSPNFGISPLMPFLIRKEMRASDFVTPCRSAPRRRAHRCRSNERNSSGTRGGNYFRK